MGADLELVARVLVAMRRDQHGEALEAFARNLEVSSAPKSSILHMTFAHENPDLAAATLNRFVSEYLSYRQHVFSGGAADGLSHQRGVIEQRLETADAALRDERARYALGDYEAESAAATKLFGDLIEEQARLEASLREAEEMTDLVQASGKPLAGELSMSVIPTIAPFLLPRILPRLRKERPELTLYLREETSHDAVESLHHGRADCVLLALPFATGDVETAHISDDRLFVAFPENDPRDPPDAVPPSMIEEGRLLLLEDGHCLRDHALAACNRPDLRGSATMIGTSLHTLVQMVDGGLGVTMLPEMALDAGILTGTQVVARPLKAKNAAREIALIWRKNSPRRGEFELLAEELRAG